jgi:large subunit ribosomal protein L10
MANTALKEVRINELRARFEASPLIILADFKGATVKEMDRIRRGVETGGVRFQVVKNTLCERALEGTEKAKLAEHFRGNIGVLFSSADPIATAKLLKEKLKESQKFVVKAGFFEGDVLDAKGVAAIAELPGREEMLVTVLRTIQEGPRQILGVVQGPARDLLYVLNNYASKLEEDGQSA